MKLLRDSKDSPLLTGELILAALHRRGRPEERMAGAALIGRLANALQKL